MASQNQGPGIYFDGKIGAAHSVIVKLEDAALAIGTPDGAPLARWDYPDIKRLPSMADRLRLAVDDDGSTARLQIRDPAFADAVKQHLGVDTPLHMAKERRQRRLVVVWTAAAVAAVLTIAVAGLPAITELATPFVSHEMEARIGQAMHENALSELAPPALCGNAGEREKAGKAAFDKLFRPFETAANLPIPVRVFILRTKAVNASAAPGGILHFNDGFIQFAQSPEELAGTIAHELGHLVHRHGLKGFLHGVGLSFLVAMAVGDVFTATGVYLAAHGNLNRRNTRAQERQADAFEAQLMAKLGVDTYPTAEGWERLDQLVKKFRKEDERSPLLHETHPGHLERAAFIRSKPRIANSKPLLTAEEWKTLREVCSGK